MRPVSDPSVRSRLRPPLVLAVLLWTTLLSHPAEAQVDVLWTRQFGSAGFTSQAFSVAVAPDGGVVVAGFTDGVLPGQTAAGNGDAYVRKYDATGTELWTRQFGTTNSDRAFSVAVALDGSVYVGGATEGVLPGQTSAGGRDAFVRKYDATGTALWTRQFGVESLIEVMSVGTAPDGSVYVAGWTSGTLSGQTALGEMDAFVRKYDATGTALWTRQFGTPGDDQAFSVAVSPDGSVYVAGVVGGALPGQFPPGGLDAFVRKYDASGTEVWTRQFGSALGEAVDDQALSVAVVPGGGLVVAGSTNGALPGHLPGFGSGDAFVRKYDASGTEVWTNQFGSPAFDKAYSVAVFPDGALVVAGETFGVLPGQIQAGSGDAFVRKYDAGGNEVWSSQFGSATGDIAISVAVATDIVYVTGNAGTLPGQTSAGIFVRALRAAPLARLINISTRGKVLTGADILIGGFVITGSFPKRVLVKAWGPRLGAFGVPGTLPDPFLDLVDQATGQVIAINDDWQVTSSCAPGVACAGTDEIKDVIVGSNFDPCLPVNGSIPVNCQKEALLLLTLPPSQAGYTARVSGIGGGTGVGLVEVTEFNEGVEHRLINISTRGKVLTGADILIGGFVTGGSGPKRVLVKAWGPRLGALGVPGTLIDPFLDLVDQATGQVIASNDNWQSAPFCAQGLTCESTAQLVGTGFDPCLPISGVPPANCEKEAILIVTLPPSASGYTARVSGVAGGTGVSLVEVTELP